MPEDPNLQSLRWEAKQAVEEVRRARQGWGTSQATARDYLAAREQQLRVFQDIEAVDPDASMGGTTISDAIEAVERNIASIEAEIPRLKPGY